LNRMPPTHHGAEPEIAPPPSELPAEVPPEVPPLPSEPMPGAIPEIPTPPGELPPPAEPEVTRDQTPRMRKARPLWRSSPYSF